MRLPPTTTEEAAGRALEKASAGPFLPPSAYAAEEAGGPPMKDSLGRPIHSRLAKPEWVATAMLESSLQKAGARGSLVPPLKVVGERSRKYAAALAAVRQDIENKRVGVALTGDDMYTMARHQQVMKAQEELARQNDNLTSSLQRQSEELQHAKSQVRFLQRYATEQKARSAKHKTVAHLHTVPEALKKFRAPLGGLGGGGVKAIDPAPDRWGARNVEPGRGTKKTITAANRKETYDRAAGKLRKIQQRDDLSPETKKDTLASALGEMARTQAMAELAGRDIVIEDSPPLARGKAAPAAAAGEFTPLKDSQGNPIRAVRKRKPLARHSIPSQIEKSRKLIEQKKRAPRGGRPAWNQDRTPSNGAKQLSMVEAERRERVRRQAQSKQARQVRASRATPVRSRYAPSPGKAGAVDLSEATEYIQNSVRGVVSAAEDRIGQLVQGMMQQMSEHYQKLAGRQAPGAELFTRPAGQAVSYDPEIQENVMMVDRQRAQPAGPPVPAALPPAFQQMQQMLQQMQAGLPAAAAPRMGVPFPILGNEWRAADANAVGGLVTPDQSTLLVQDRSQAAQAASFLGGGTPARPDSGRATPLRFSASGASTARAPPPVVVTLPERLVDTLVERRAAYRRQQAILDAPLQGEEGGAFDRIAVAEDLANDLVEGIMGDCIDEMLGHLDYYCETLFSNEFLPAGPEHRAELSGVEEQFTASLAGEFTESPVSSRSDPVSTSPEVSPPEAGRRPSDDSRSERKYSSEFSESIIEEALAGSD